MREITGRVLGIDPGEKRIGVAISDPTGTIARPLIVLKHISRPIDAAKVVEIAREQAAVEIVVGCPLGADGEKGATARRAERFAEAIRQAGEIPVVLWDESGSTREARAARIEMGVSRRRRSGHLDDLAAALILQSYLDFSAAQPTPSSNEEI